jgi:hypothetical protein
MAATIGDSVFLIHRLSTSACEMHRYSIREGTWDSRPAPAFPENYYGAVCAYDGQIWQLGGWQDSRRFQRYSPQTGVWDSLPDSPANTGGNSPGLAASGGRIWLWGGGAGWVPTRGVASYDKSTNAWYPDTDMPEAIMAGAFGILDSAGTPGLHGACGYRTLAIHYRGAGLATAVTESQATPAPHRGIVVSPNPARGRALVSLASPAVGAATSLTVFDATGRSVRTILVRGRSIVLDGLEPGIYLLRLDAAGSATGRLVVLD